MALALMVAVLVASASAGIITFKGKQVRIEILYRSSIDRCAAQSLGLVVLVDRACSLATTPTSERTNERANEREYSLTTARNRHATISSRQIRLSDIEWP